MAKTLKRFVDFCRQIFSVYLTTLWGLRLKVREFMKKDTSKRGRVYNSSFHYKNFQNFNNKSIIDRITKQLQYFYLHQE